MLRRHERRRLDEIERRLTAEEPELARLATTELPGPARSRVLTVLTWIAAAVAAVSLILGEVPPALLAVLVVAMLLCLRRWRFHG